MPEPDRPLRILHCFRSPVGGIFRHVRDLAEQHSQDGHAVGILCDSTTGGSYEDGLFDGIRPFLALGLTRIPIRRSIGPRDLGAVLDSFNTIKGLQPDILHGHGAKGGALARIIGSRLRVSGSRVARIYSPHGGSLHYDPGRPSGRLYFALERLMERWTDRLVFVSDYERTAYAEKVGAPRPPFSVIRNGLREEEFEPVATAADAADFLYVGMMRDLKGPDLFIEALAAAEARLGRPVSAAMVGDGPDRPRYEQMVAALGLDDRVTVRPAMPVREAFALARIVCVPSRAESMPYIVLEALAARRPLIATRVGGIPEVLGSSSPALVPPDDREALAARMAEALDHPERLAAALPGREGFARSFSARTMAASLLAAYRESLEEAPPAPFVRTVSSLS